MNFIINAHPLAGCMVVFLAMVVIAVVITKLIMPLLTAIGVDDKPSLPSYSEPVLVDSNKLQIYLNKREAKRGLVFLPFLCLIGAALSVGSIAILIQHQPDDGKFVFFMIFGAILIAVGVFFLIRCMATIRDNSVKLLVTPSEVIDYQSGGPVAYPYSKIALITLKLNNGIGMVGGGPALSAVIELLLRPDASARLIPIGHLDINPDSLAHTLQIYLNAHRAGAPIDKVYELRTWADLIENDNLHGRSEGPS